jgi:hypothetical protein
MCFAFVHQKYLFVPETWVQFGQGDDDAVAVCGLHQQTRRQPLSSEGFAKRYSGLLKYFCHRNSARGSVWAVHFDRGMSQNGKSAADRTT